MIKEYKASLFFGAIALVMMIALTVTHHVFGPGVLLLLIPQFGLVFLGWWRHERRA